MKNLHKKNNSLFFAPTRAIFEEAFDIEQSTETQIYETINDISTDLEKTSVEEAIRTAKKKIDDVANKGLKKIKADKDNAEENKPYIDQIVLAQKTAKESIDKNMETYRNIQKYFKIETETRILLQLIKDAGGDKDVSLEGKDALALLAKLKPLSTKLEAKYAQLDELNLMNDPTAETRRGDFHTNEVDTLKGTLTDNISKLREGVLTTLSKETISAVKGDRNDDPSTPDFNESSETVGSQFRAKGIVSLADIVTLQQKSREVDELLAGLKKIGGEDQLIETATGLSLNYHEDINEAHKALAETDKTGKLALETDKLPKLKKSFEDALANREKLLKASKEEKAKPDYKQKLSDAYSWYKGTQKAYGDQQQKILNMEDAVDKINLANGVYEKGIFDEDVPSAKFKVEGIDDETGKAVDWLDSVGDGRRITVQGVNIYVDRTARNGENQFAIYAEQNKELGLKKDITGSKEFVLKEIARIADEKKTPTAPEESPPSDTILASNR